MNGSSYRPWIGILSGSKDRKFSGHSCSGSLINHKYLISSASCICQLLQKKCTNTNSSKYIFFAPPNMTIYARFPFATHLSKNKNIFNIKGCYIHGLYNSSNGSDDIAVLSLIQKYQFSDLDCQIDPQLLDFHDKNIHRVKCGINAIQGNHSIMTAFKSSRDSENSYTCLTNSIGPIKYEPCVSNFKNFSACQQFRSPFSVPLSPKCEDALKYLNESNAFNSSAMFVNIKMGSNYMLSCPNKGFNETQLKFPQWPNRESLNQIRHGWCYTCKKHLSQCRNWGYCIKECSRKDKGPGPFLLEKLVYTFTSKKLSLCGDYLKQFCLTGQLIQAPGVHYDIQNSFKYMWGDSNVEIREKNEDYTVKVLEDNNAYAIRKESPVGMMEDLDEFISYSRKDFSMICDEHSGGSIWKKLNVSFLNENMELAVLTGIISRTGNLCNTTIRNLEKGIPIHTRLMNYLPWILSITDDGKCEAHKNDLYINKLNAEHFEESLGLTPQFYCNLKLNKRGWDPDFLNPDSETYKEWSSIFHNITQPLKNIENVERIVFFEFLLGPPSTNISASFAIITTNKTNVFQLKKEIQSTEFTELPFLYIQNMINEVSFGVTSDHLDINWKWAGPELNITVKERSKTPLMKLSLGLSHDYGHLANMKRSFYQIYRAHINKKIKKGVVVNIREKGSISSLDSEIVVQDLSLVKKNDHWITTFSFQTKNVQNIGINKNGTFCFLMEVHQDIGSVLTNEKFPITSQHCFLDIE
ncbi:uncharacterized protein [Lepeophtheirus salmonis]|uniref:uncharacterized protein isoform X2 n=1 Tax=Lepeophtheirus salmonis TaxID=72036 RepID=UPI003AF3C756